jgi:tetratricopeptide (TPR) repeat protein
VTAAAWLLALVQAAASEARPAAPNGPPKVKTASASVTREATLVEPAAAREAARQCEESEDREAALAACREALRLGLQPPRRGAVRKLLELHLVQAGRFDELVEAYREDSAHRPSDPEGWRRLGSALLYFKEDSAGARTALEEARRLRPDDIETLLALGVCLNAQGEHALAVAAFEEALRKDPRALDLKPAARSALDASRRGERWP